MENRNFHQTWFLTRFSLKRDWLKLALWSVTLIVLFAAVAAKFTTIYDSQASIDEIVKTLKSPSMVSLFGKLSGSGPYTTADVFAGEMTVFMAMIAAVMNFSIIIKNTRGEEDSGLLEIIQSHSVGKLSNLASSLIELLIINLVIGIFYSLGLQFAGLSGTDTNGNFLLGLGLGAAGFMFASIAALMAQLVDNSRFAMILSYIIFGIMYIARMSTDISNPNLTWLIPFGWVEKFSTYQDNNWLPVFLMLGLSLILCITALWINNHRDIGSGIIATKPGRATASVFLRGPLSLFFRLHRTSIIVWIIGLMILGFTYGSIFNTIGDILKTNPTMAQLIGASAVHKANVVIIKHFVAILMIVFACLALFPGIQIINYLKTGESKGYLELIHSKPVSRSYLFTSILLLGIATSVATLFASMMGLYLGGMSVMKHPVEMSVFLNSFAAYLSALLVVLAISGCIVGLIPRFSSFSYLYIGFALFSGYFGKLIDLPKWVAKLTPFGYIPDVPVGKIDPGTMWWQLGITFVLIVVGYIGYSCRDLKS
ncbi:ABC transporter permease [Companilactobacillus allii]|uniref:ABC transporter permease n=1 Tax=Companilactobacillus allii TaxID=1847728 RepID=A0A1P8Q0G1_9LACO|nr:ABC transporter permease [Companilactobacillus allii]APX71360.1 ABC transporter permease [Companilactobacillus allii]USQ68442.1 ABC transporter permease [Companilactobacillus allii]